MPAPTRQNPRAEQPAAASTRLPLPPSDGRKTQTQSMSRAQWDATPADYKLTKGGARYVLQANPNGGVGLYPVSLTEA
ncbi:hypothetical protein [Thiomonas sp.]|uniref:hypothetical protein n=1 Tax=Thiomonas sp. TaxID=2047785 RepID=UPI0026353773|nr:hypothetical protein [Thiomonas sp.]